MFFQYLFNLTIFVVFNLLVLINSQNQIFVNTFAFLALLYVPGSLVLSSLNFKKWPFWENTSFAVGLSTVLIMLAGLFMNFAFPVFGIYLPLSKDPFLVFFDIIVIGLLIANFYQLFIVKKHRINIQTDLVKTPKKLITLIAKPHFGISVVFFFGALFLVTLSVMGSVILTTRGYNQISLIFIGSVSLFIILITFLRNHMREWVLPMSIYFVGLALLLLTSLRGNYMTGHDVQFEYYIFHLTKLQNFWSINFYKDAYNACLSITILPTLLSNFFIFNDVYIYKIVFQIIFAFCPVSIYYLLKKYSTPFVSFIATFFFLTFPTFLIDMPMLNRQEIAFLFYSLILLIFFTKETIPGRKAFLFLFGFGIVSSHYSTNYITTASFTLTYLAFHLLKNKFVKKFILNIPALKFICGKIYQSRLTAHIPGSLLIFLFALTLIWNGFVTKTSNNLVNTTVKAVTSVSSIFSQENKSVDIAYSLLGGKKLSDEEYLKSYLDKSIQSAKSERVQGFFDEDDTASYETKIIKNQLVPLTYLGSVIENAGLNVFAINYFFRQFLAKFIQLLIVIGVLGILFIKSGKIFDGEYLIMCFVALLLIVLMLVLPGVSVSYGLLRLFQQFLVILGLPAVMAIVLFFKKFKDTATSLVLTAVVLFFFLNLSGFISEITGGYFPELNLRNGGTYYNAYYVHKSEVDSIKWLSGVIDTKTTVQSERISRDKLWAYGNIPSIDGSIPQTFRRDAFVFVSFINNLGKSVVSADRSLIANYPLDFLDNNKNLIYNNGQSRIYR